MGHTPGPWMLGSHGWMDEGRAHGSGGWSGRFRRIIGDDGVVARVYCGTDDTDDADSRHPNVLLISAAPDLLTACHTVAHDLQAALDGDDFSGMPDEELFRAFLNVLRPAIAKAEGTDGKARSMD